MYLLSLIFLLNKIIFHYLSYLLQFFLWEDNIKMDLQELGGGCGDWMELAQDREKWRALVSTEMNFRVR